MSRSCQGHVYDDEGQFLIMTVYVMGPKWSLMAYISTGDVCIYVFFLERLKDAIKENVQWLVNNYSCQGHYKVKAIKLLL